MSDSFCGNNCEKCTYRTELHCPGCKTGPGNAVSGDCIIAKCCIGNGCQACETCQNSNRCENFAFADSHPEDRLLRYVRQQELKETKDRKALRGGKWFPLLFWLILISIGGAILSDTDIIQAAPVNYLGKILIILYPTLYAVILLKLRSESEAYRTAGILNLIMVPFSILLMFWEDVPLSPWGRVLFLVTGLVLYLIAAYFEFRAHAGILRGLNDSMSRKWTRLWKCSCGFFAGFIAGMLCILWAKRLSFVLMVPCAGGIAVTFIIKMVLLKKAARFFKDYPDSHCH